MFLTSSFIHWPIWAFKKYRYQKEQVRPSNLQANKCWSKNVQSVEYYQEYGIDNDDYTQVNFFPLAQQIPQKAQQKPY